MENKPETHYSFQPLDQLVTHYYDPIEIGNQLDEVMSDLVNYASKDEAYSSLLADRHSMLRELRDIFWKLVPAREASADTMKKRK